MARAALARPLSVRSPARPLPRGSELEALEPLLYDRRAETKSWGCSLRKKTSNEIDQSRFVREGGSRYEKEEATLKRLKRTFGARDDGQPASCCCWLDYFVFFDFFLSEAGLVLSPPPLLPPLLAPLLRDPASSASPAAFEDDAAGFAAPFRPSAATAFFT